MTDKEKIIIDGVNVSQCEFYIYYSSDRYPHRCGIHKDMFGIPACCDVADCCKNCYFKQLKHKKQECEELKKEIINKNEKIKELRFSVSDLTNRLCYLNAEKSFRIVDLEQTLDEIEKELKERLVRTEEDLKYQCVDCMNVKSDHYRRALEEIEEVINNILNSCLGRNTVSCRPAHNVCGDLINILDIINKAKGE